MWQKHKLHTRMCQKHRLHIIQCDIYSTYHNPAGSRHNLPFQSRPVGCHTQHNLPALIAEGPTLGTSTYQVAVRDTFPSLFNIHNSALLVVIVPEMAAHRISVPFKIMEQSYNTRLSHFQKYRAVPGKQWGRQRVRTPPIRYWSPTQRITHNITIYY